MKKNKVRGEHTGTQRFISGFYFLTDLTAAFNQMDHYLIGLENTVT